VNFKPVDGGYQISVPGPNAYALLFDEGNGATVHGQNTAEASTTWKIVCANKSASPASIDYLCGIFHGEPSAKKCAVYADGDFKMSECDPEKMTAPQVGSIYMAWK
jgi:hypothetical protein